MMFYQHQNFLIIIDFILHRLPPESSQNVWAHALQALVANKRSRKLKKNENVNALRQNNEIISNFIKTICRMINKRKQTGDNQEIKEQQFPKPIYTTVAGILRQIQKCQVSRARELVLRALDASLFKAENQKKDHFLPPISAEGTLVHDETEVGGVGDHHTLQQIAAHGGGGTALGANADPDKLPEVFPPFLPKLTEEQKKKDTFTLVLDLDETLVHYFEIQGEGHFLVRPGAQKFLLEMSKIYELVIFTAAMQDYADCVLDQMDSKRYISYRLYRQHALPYGNIFVKDLSRLGRDLSRVIIVDNVAQNFQLQPDNGIFIRSWFDDPEDTALEELAPLLKEVVKKKLDVRLALKKFRDQMLDQISRGITNPKLSLDDTANSIEA